MILGAAMALFTANAFAQNYTNEPATISWPFNEKATYATDYTAVPTDAFSIVSFDATGHESAGTEKSKQLEAEGQSVTFTKILAEDKGDEVKWFVKPASGLSFTPTSVHAYIARCGTDVENGMNVYVQKEGGQKITLANYTAHRINKVKADDKFGSAANYATRFDITLTAAQQAELAGSDGFYLIMNLGVGSTKSAGFSEVKIEGNVSGTKADVEMFTVSVAAEPAEGGTVSMTPAMASFEAGTEIKLTASSKEGYRFSKWVDADGNLVANVRRFTYKVTKNTELKAIFTEITPEELEKSQGVQFVVPDDGNFRQAIAAANDRDIKSERYVIYVRKGTHHIPVDETRTQAGNDGKSYFSPKLMLTAPNTSIVGEGWQETIIINDLDQPDARHDNGFGPSYPLEGLHNVTTLSLEKNAVNTYIQGVQLRNGMPDATGRGEALGDYSNKTILKDACLYGYQDTYCGNNGSGFTYMEGGQVRGRTDYLCGKGCFYFNGVTLMNIGAGYIAVPSSSNNKGFVFKDCIIDGENSSSNNKYTLGRPWGQGTPEAVFIDTKMIQTPSAAGWNEMSGGYPKRFAEYNSKDGNGKAVDLSKRKTKFGSTDKNGIHDNNPVLTREEAYDTYSYESIFTSWDPKTEAMFAPVPTTVIVDPNNLVTWDDNSFVSFWAVYKDGKYVASVSEPKYQGEAGAKYSVRSANKLGGLGDAVEAVQGASINEIIAESSVVAEIYYNLYGVRVAPETPGVYVRVVTLADGRVLSEKIQK